MRRLALGLVTVAVATLLPSAPSSAGLGTDDVYRSQLVAHDRDGRIYEMETVVDDRSSGTWLFLTLRRRCESCRATTYVKALKPGELTVHYESAAAECVCFVASVETKFGGKPFSVHWVWDPEQGGDHTAERLEWSTVTANNLLNVSCFASGTYTATPTTFSGGPAPRPKGAKKFPSEMPAQFRSEYPRSPGCYSDSP